MTSIHFVRGSGTQHGQSDLAIREQTAEHLREHRLGLDEVTTFNSKGEVIQTHSLTIWQLVVEYTPGLSGFMELPAVPKSNVPSQSDCGITRARHKLHTILTETSSKLGALVMAIMMATILLSITTFCVESFPESRMRREEGVYGETERTFETVEMIVVAIFTSEYVARLFTVTAVPSERELAFVQQFGWRAVGDGPAPLSYPATYNHFMKWMRVSLGKLRRHVFNPLTLVDAVSIIPYFVEQRGHANVPSSLTILRVLRLARIMRLFKLSLRFEGLQILTSTVLTALDALGFLLFFLMLAIVLFGSIIFLCEAGVWDPELRAFMRPDVHGTGRDESPFRSIPHSFWWCIVTMTTVGYGDMAPTTPWGKAAGTVIMLCGIMTLALPITVVGSAFTEEYAKFKEKKVSNLLASEEAKAIVEEENNKNAKAPNGSVQGLESSAVDKDPRASESSAAGTHGASDPLTMVSNPIRSPVHGPHREPGYREATVVPGTVIFPPTVQMSSKGDAELDLLIALRGRGNRMAQIASRAAALKKTELALTRKGTSDSMLEAIANLNRTLLDADPRPVSEAASLAAAVQAALKPDMDKMLAEVAGQQAQLDRLHAENAWMRQALEKLLAK